MDKKYYNAVISEMQVLLDGQKFVSDGDIFKNETKAVKVSFKEESRQFVLELADVAEGAVGEFSVANAWLFEEGQTERDAAAVGVDFADTLRENLGVKKARGVAQVELPVGDKSDSGNITTLTQKLLAVFPQFKDDYKQSVSEHSRFLYLNFYMAKFVPAIKVMMETGTKKQVKKLFDMLADIYVSGNGEATDAVVAIICAATFGDQAKFETAMEQLADCQHLQVAVRQFSAILAKNKKLQAALIK